MYDGQGDVIGLVDVSSGSEVATYGYDAWGNEIPSLTSDNSGTNAGTINPFTYRGYVYDSQTGLYYLNARYYNQVTGRFLSEDPVSPNASDALSNNEYAYVENNPVNLVDPSGTAPYSVYVNARFGIKVNGFTRNDAITLWNYFKVPAWFFRDFIIANPDLRLLRIGDAWLAYKGTGEVYSAEGNAALRATRRPAFENWLQNGVKVGNKTFKLHIHAFNSLFKSGRKDIMPADITQALSQSARDAKPGSVEYVNPHTGTSVFVNPSTDEIVGIWPGSFKK
ncbi:MAG: RHS repeat-associated core domain-containing protein [Bacilli bacterium]